MFEITTDFLGGNIKTHPSRGGSMRLSPDCSGGNEWFYWAFCVSGAAGQTVRFDFGEKHVVGYWGPAVSHNLKDWYWLGEGASNSFSYTFAQEENRVYFAHHMLYHPDRFTRFAQGKGLGIGELCLSEKGRSVPCVHHGGGEKTILLTARHHACESTGSYVQEGVLDGLTDGLPPQWSVLCVPFVDYDGVVDGAQGKGRHPHDHNRDYNPAVPALYPAVAAIRRMAAARKIIFGFDFHAPWHLGGVNDLAFIVQPNWARIERFRRFSALLEGAVKEDAFAYRGANDVLPGQDWNKTGSPNFSNYINALPESELAFTLETAYFGTKENVFTQAKALMLGRAFAEAVKAYIASM